MRLISSDLRMVELTEKQLARLKEFDLSPSDILPSADNTGFHVWDKEKNEWGHALIKWEQ